MNKRCLTVPVMFIVFGLVLEGGEWKINSVQDVKVIWTKHNLDCPCQH